MEAKILEIMRAHGIVSIPPEILASLQDAGEGSALDRLEKIVDALTAWLLKGGFGSSDALSLCYELHTYLLQGSSDSLALLPLLIAAASRLPAGVRGLRDALRLIVDAKALPLMQRAAFASALRSHLSESPVDHVFVFPPPEAPGPNQSERKARIELPSSFNWSTFRGYTLMLWLRVDAETFATGDAILFSFRNMSGHGVEGRLAAPSRGGSDRLSKDYQEYHTLRITAYTRDSRNKTVAVSLPELAGVDGRWRMLTISHSLPYVKKSVIKVHLDGQPRFTGDLVYPTGSSADFDAMSRSCLCEGLVGGLASAAMWEDELPVEVLNAALLCGPNHLAGALPLAVPRAPIVLTTGLAKGAAASGAASARLIWALLPHAAAGGTSGGCYELSQVGQTQLHHVEVATASASTGAVVARLSNGVTVSTPYQMGVIPTAGSGRSSRTVTAFLGIHDAWFRAGGVRALIHAVGCIVDELALGQGGEVEDQAGSMLLCEVLEILALLMEESPTLREDMLQCHGFHMIAFALKRLPRPVVQLDHRVLTSCTHLLSAARRSDPNPPGTNDLYGAALQGLLFDIKLWWSAAPSVRSSVLATVRADAPSIERFVGVQALLDGLRIHVCPDNAQASGASDGGEAGEQLADCISSFETMLVEILESALGRWTYVYNSADGMIEAGEHGAPNPRGSPPPAYSNAERSQGRAPLQLQALIQCLNDTKNSVLAGVLLRILLQLRKSQPANLCRGLCLCGFASTTAPAILAPLPPPPGAVPVNTGRASFSNTGGTSSNAAPGSGRWHHIEVRKDCLALLLWVLFESRKSGEVRLLPCTSAYAPGNNLASPSGIGSPPTSPSGTGAGTSYASHQHQHGHHHHRDSPASPDAQTVHAGGGDRVEGGGSHMHLHIALSVAEGGWGSISDPTLSSPSDAIQQAPQSSPLLAEELVDVILGEGKWEISGASPPWLSLPFAAAILPSSWLTTSSRARAVTALGMAIKRDTMARAQLLGLSRPLWAESLLEISFLERSAGLGWEVVHTGYTHTGAMSNSGRGTPANSSRTPAAPAVSIFEELSLDSLGFVISEAMSASTSGWRLWNDLLTSLRRMTGPAACDPSWLPRVLANLTATALHRALRGGPRGASHALDCVGKLLVLSEERLLPPPPPASRPALPQPPGDTPSALITEDNMNAVYPPAPPPIQVISTSGDISDAETSSLLGGSGAGRAISGDSVLSGTSRSGINLTINTGSTGLQVQGVAYPPAMTPALWHLLGCVLEAGESLREASQAAAESEKIALERGLHSEDETPGGAGALPRLRSAMGSTLRILTRSLALRGETVQQATLLATEVRECLQAFVSLCSLYPVQSALACDMTLTVLVGLRRAVSLCTDDAHREDMPITWKAEAQERKALLEAVTMDLVDRMSVTGGGGSGSRNPGTQIAALLRSALDCNSVDEIFTVLQHHLNKAEAETQQDMADVVPLFSSLILSTPTDSNSNTSDSLRSPTSLWQPGSPSMHPFGGDLSVAIGTAGAAGPVLGTIHRGAWGPLLSGGGAGRASLWLWANHKRHHEVCETERARLVRRSSNVSIAAQKTRKVWVRMSRQAEMERDAALGTSARSSGPSHPQALTGLCKKSHWKVGGSQHDGQHPGKLRAVLQPVVRTDPLPTLQKVRARATKDFNTANANASAGVRPAVIRRMSTEEMSLKLAQALHIVDITKAEAGESDAGEGETKEEDTWGVVASGPDDSDASLTYEGYTTDENTARDGSDGNNKSRSSTLESVEEGGADKGQGGINDGTVPGDEFDVAAAGAAEQSAAGTSRNNPEDPHDLSPGCDAPQAPLDWDKLGEAVTLVTPKGNTRGRILTVNRKLVFVPQAAQQGETVGTTGAGVSDDASTVPSTKVMQWSLNHVSAVYSRRYRLCDSAIEMFLSRGTRRSLYIDFGVGKEETGRRDEFLRLLQRLCPPGALKHWPSEVRKLMRLWQGRHITNYDYLMGLNTLAGRSFNDMCQYPVFPWVLQCYTSKETTLDLMNPANYRDLSKPMGAMDDQRLKEFLERYESFQDPDIPGFMYGSHYSTAVGVVLHFLVRLQPFADLHQAMQGGTFDVPDRLFSSIPRSWELCTSALSEVKELTPEWYTLPDFLRNINEFQLGATQDGDKVNDVGLPAWASSPEDFILKHRIALESEFVSANLHQWVDLIFGFKQQGRAAVEAHNVFYYLTYYGAVDLTMIEDESLRSATELQIAHFGQCPMQMFFKPHPPRGSRVLVPRPLKASMSGMDKWIEDSARLGRRTLKCVPPITRGSPGANIRSCRILPHGRILTVSALGVLELYRYYWADEAAEAALRSTEGGARHTRQGDSVSEMPGAGDEVSAENPVVVVQPQLQDPLDLLLGPSIPTSSEITQNTDGTMITSTEGESAICGVEVQRMTLPFSVLPRILLPTGLENYPGRYPLPPSPVLFSKSGRLIFSGGHATGSIRMWQIDPDSCSIIGEAAIYGHSAPVTCLALCDLERNGSELMLLSGSADCTAALWGLRQLNSPRPFKRPRADRCPMCILRGHDSPVIACAVSEGLGLTLTCSSSQAITHCIETGALIRSLPRSSTTRYHACALSSEGYAILACSSSAESISSPTGAVSSDDANELVAFTVNGQLVARVEGPGVGSKGLVMAGGGQLILHGGVDVLVAARHVPDLTLIWALKPEACIQRGLQWDNAIDLVASAVSFIESGPGHDTPEVLCLGMSDGTLALQALPDTEQWLLRHLQGGGYGAALIGRPVKIVKGTVSNVQSIAARAAKGFGGVVKTGGGIAKELTGEAGTIGRAVQSAGLVRGIAKYWRGDSGESR